MDLSVFNLDFSFTLAYLLITGAGKSTLLNTLAGRTPMSSGTITVNGQIITKDLRRKICYVLQQDIFFSSLTLRETLQVINYFQQITFC